MIVIDRTDYPDGSSLISHVSPMCCVDMAIDPKHNHITVDTFDTRLEIPVTDIDAWIAMLQHAKQVSESVRR